MYYEMLNIRINMNLYRFVYDSTEPVELDVFVKNVSTLIIKIFEINTMSYYRENLSEINTKINLDGLVPNEEMVFEYKDAPIVRTLRKIAFPNLNKRGAFVIDVSLLRLFGATIF